MSIRKSRRKRRRRRNKTKKESGNITERENEQ